MKRYNNIFKTVGLAFAFILFFNSCDQWIDTDLNIDPDAPADVPMNLMLPAIEQALGYNMAGNDLVRTTNIWMQQFDGVTRQSLTEARYQLLPADVNNVWNSFYTQILMNSLVLMDKAENTEGKESPYNAGVARVIIATTMGITTDLFGDMPFSEAFKGNENVLTPKFDTQEQIYATINEYLDAAIANLGSAENLVAIGGDVIYGGSAAKWKKAAYAIKARQALQLSDLKGNAAYTEALAAAANGFTSNADNFLVPWEANNHNPIFQFMEQRTDVRMGSTLVDMLITASDPRLPFYAEKDANGEYTGSEIGFENENASKPGYYLAGVDAPSVIMSYAELKFIEAEANFKLNQKDKAQAAFEAGVAASVLQVTGSANTEWLDANINGVTVSLELIMAQKYIATAGTNQAFSDYRRTGLPVMVQPNKAVLPKMPTRFPYAQDEITYNTANVPSVTISDKLWWDK